MRAVLPATALAAVCLVPFAGAHPPAPVDKRGEPVYGKRHQWLHQSKMPLFSGRVRLISGACPGRPAFAGCVFSRRPRTLYVRPGARNPKSVIYHELGHSFDLMRLRHRDRAAFKRHLRIRGRGWFRGTVPPSELFAEAYALCSRFGMRRPPASKLGWTQSVYGYRPSRAQHRSVCRLIARAGANKRATPQPPRNAPPVIEQQPPQPPSQQPEPAPLVPGLPPTLPLPGAV